MKLRTRWGWTAVVLAFPYIALVISGAVWMYQQGWWWQWLAMTALASLVVWLLTRAARNAARPAGQVGPLPKSHSEPSPYWPPAGMAAWKKIDHLASVVDPDQIPLDRPEPAWTLLQQILDIAAREFHSKAAVPVLEVPIPHVLRIVELVSHDLRKALSQNVPGSHILTINDLQRVHEWSRWVPWVQKAYRIGAAIFNPVNAIVREMSNWAQGDLVDISAQHTKHWMLQLAVRRAGFYAIELYSGQLVLHDVGFGDSTSGISQKSQEAAQRRSEKFENEPFRVLILGQVKAGKSSLVNALFGEIRAAVDVVPRTREVEPYVLEREGLRRAIILDTAGYDDATTPDKPSQQATAEVLQSDLILLVSSATTAARAADRRLLDQWRARFQSEPNREFPPLVVALTHIDQLRPFREWSPPYDLQDTVNIKAQSIRSACEATAADLQLVVEQIVPVCLAPGQIYNVEESLIPTMLGSLDSANRVRCLRCLREMHDEEYWRKLGEQAVNGGRILWKIGRQLFNQYRERSRSGSNLNERKS